MNRRIKNSTASFALVVSLGSMALPAAAEAPIAAEAPVAAEAPAASEAPVAAETPASDLRSPEQRSVRQSGYVLPKGLWAVELGALGVTGEELYASLGFRYGVGAGVEFNLNLMHYVAGLFNVSARWGFLELEHFALAANVDFIYGHGDWMWLLAPFVKRLLEDADIFAVPIGVTASGFVLDWLQLDLGVSYRFGTVLGTLGEGNSFYADAQIGAQQFLIRPGARLYVSDATALELAFDLPLYTWVPYEGELTLELRDRGYERSGEGGATVPLSDAWKFEIGVRSRLNAWLFCALRLHYGRANRFLYSTTINPSLSFEARL